MRRSAFGLVVLILVLLLTSPAVAQQAAGNFTILVTNDDGFDAPGLRALVEALRPLGELYVSAPAMEQSGKGHSVATTREPILVSERRQPDGKTWFAVEAPPATCVRLGLEVLLPRRPDVVISGINRGENLGILVYYSGTLGAAREAAISGIPAIAVSMRGNDERDYVAAAAFIQQLVKELRARQLLKPGLFLNVNVPSGERKGVEVARLSTRATHERFERRTSPRGRVYFWSAWEPLETDEVGTDVAAFARGFITLTPMSLDVTNPAAIESLKALGLGQPAAAVK